MPMVVGTWSFFFLTIVSSTSISASIVEIVRIFQHNLMGFGIIQSSNSSFKLL